MDTERLLGQQVDRYRITRHVAEGGMAHVFLADDLDLHRPAALKVMRDALALDENFKERFRREAQVVARLDHPNIIQVFGIGTTPLGQPYIAMQYIEGGSLREKLKQLAERDKLLTTEQALNITRQIALALSVAHKAKIVHRDLKPANVLIRRDGTPVLVDLGIAAVGDGPKLTQTGNIMGTPHYMSPEQVRGQKLDGRSDIYSLGIILYEMLAGTRPFEADESIAVLHKQAYEEPPPLRLVRPDLSRQTLSVVETCMQKEPERRFQNADAVVTAIDQALKAEGVHGPNPQATQVLTNLADSELWSRMKVVREPTDKSLGEREKPHRVIPMWAIATAVTLAAAIALVFILQSSGSDEPSGFPTAVPIDDVVEVVTQVVVTTATAEPTDETVPTQPPEAAAPPTAVPAPTEAPSPTETPPLADVYIGQDGVKMNLIPAGPFLMGSTDSEVDQAISLCRQSRDNDSCARSEFASEMPQHSVTLSDYYIDVTEITNAQYQACVNTGACNPPGSSNSYYGRSQYAAYPVVGVTWFDARDYCIWVGERLPTEAEWEKAARGDDGRLFPWGNTFNSNRANTQDRGTQSLLPVGQYANGASPYGILDMAGSVWEYVEDWFDPNYYANSPTQDPHGPSSSPSGERVLRSGSYANYQHYARIANRGSVPPGTSTEFRGFRCVVDVTAVR